jgi:hypothetical protein
MKNKTAVEHLFKALVNGQYFIGNDVFQAYNEAKQMEKEQKFEFAKKVLENCDGGWVLEKSLETIYKETYGKDNE